VAIIPRLRLTNLAPLRSKIPTTFWVGFPIFSTQISPIDPFYSFIRDHYQVQPHQALRSFVEGIFDKEEAKLPDIENGAPALHYQRMPLESAKADQSNLPNPSATPTSINLWSAFTKDNRKKIKMIPRLPAHRPRCPACTNRV
jgi:hypothetical protein